MATTGSPIPHALFIMQLWHSFHHLESGQVSDYGRNDNNFWGEAIKGSKASAWFSRDTHSWNSATTLWRSPHRHPEGPQVGILTGCPSWDPSWQPYSISRQVSEQITQKIPSPAISLSQPVSLLSWSWSWAKVSISWKKNKRSFKCPF